LLLLVIPVIAYMRLRRADEIQDALLLRGVREQGYLAAAALAPLLRSSETAALPQLNHQLERFSTEVGSLKLLFGPGNGSGFFYVASWPTVPNSQLETERAALSSAGVLDRLSSSCEGDEPLGLHYRTPAQDDEIVSSVTPLRTASGCWVVVTTLSARSLPGPKIGQPYWQSRDVRIAAAIYLMMIVITFTTFWSIHRGLKRFVERARAISEHRDGVGFIEQNDVPDLAEVAASFDHMVEVLTSSARDLRRAAEDNAHAFKTPIAVIRQSLEPLRRGIGQENQRSARALGLIENSLDKLEGLVASARRLDEEAALSMDLPRTKLHLSGLLDRLLNGYSDALVQRGIELRRRLQKDVVVLGHEEMIETVLDNLFDNAVSFSPRGAGIEISLAVCEEVAELLVCDFGPGVPETHLEHIFDRYFSYRPPSSDAREEPSHFGVGLWIAKRNVEALGGTITAHNRTPTGLQVRITFALAERRSPAKVKSTTSDKKLPPARFSASSTSLVTTTVSRKARGHPISARRYRVQMAATAAILCAFAAEGAVIMTGGAPRLNSSIGAAPSATDRRAAPARVVATLAVAGSPPADANITKAPQQLPSSTAPRGPGEVQAPSSALSAAAIDPPAQTGVTVATSPRGPEVAGLRQATSPSPATPQGSDAADQQIAAFLSVHLPGLEQTKNVPSSEIPSAIVDTERPEPPSSAAVDPATAAQRKIADFLADRFAADTIASGSPKMSAVKPTAPDTSGQQNPAPEGAQTSVDATEQANERYVIQVGSFLDESLARRLADTLTSKAITITVTRNFARDGRVWIVLRTEEYKTLEEVDNVLRVISSIPNLAPKVIHNHLRPS